MCVIPCGFACMHTNRCTPSRLAKHAHGLIIRTDLPLYLRKTHQLPHRFIPHAAPSLVPLQPPICNTCTQPRYPCELATVPSNASVDEVSLVPLQPPICESLMPLQSPICSLLFAGLSCSLSRAFAVSCLQPPICKSLLLPLSCLCSLLFASLPHSGRGAAIRAVAQNSSRRWAGEFLNDRADGTVWGNELKMS